MQYYEFDKLPLPAAMAPPSDLLYGGMYVFAATALFQVSPNCLALSPLSHPCSHAHKLRIGVGERSLTTPARRFPSPGLLPVPMSTRTARKCGRCPSFKDRFLSPRVPTP